MSLATWSPYDQQVQTGLADGKFTNAAFMLISAGPPRLANLPGGAAVVGRSSTDANAPQVVYPMGLVQNINLSSNTQFNQIFEIGSERSFFVRGRTSVSGQFSRPMIHGMSILRVLYAYYQDLLPPTLIASAFPNIGSAAVANPHDVRIPPGYENIFLNLGSDLFSQPVGMLFSIMDSNEDTLGAVYGESLVVPNHTFGVDANGTLAQESLGFQLERLVPVATNVIGLIS